MNLDQMLVYQVENQNTNALVRALLLSQFDCRSTCVFPVGLRYRRNSFFYLVVGDNHEETIYYDVTNDVSVTETYKEAH